MSAKEPVGKGHAGLVRSKHRASDPPMLGRKSVLMGMLTSGFVIANAAQPSATAAGTVKPGAIAATTPTYLTKWAPSQAYVRGQQVVSPNNDVVSANVAHTSGSTFNAANWSVSSTYGRADSRTIHTGPLTHAGVIATLDAAEAKGSGTIAFFPAGIYNVGNGLSLSGYSCQIQGAGSAGVSGTLSGTVFYAPTQTGPVLDFTGWIPPSLAGMFTGKVSHGGFMVMGSGAADTTKVRSGVRLTVMSSATFHDISVNNTGGPAWEHMSSPGNAVYLCDFERIVLSTPVSAKANDVPYMVMNESNGNNFRGIGFHSVLTSADVGVSGALVFTGNASYTGYANKFDGCWMENLHVPTNGCLISHVGNYNTFDAFMFHDCRKETGATGTAVVRFLPPTVDNYGGNIWRGTVPGNGGWATDIDYGIDISQSYNRVEGIRGYTTTASNVRLNSGINGTFVLLGGSQSVSGGGNSVTDSSGTTTNVIVDATRDGLQFLGRVGFYGTTPVARPTGVAITAAGIHAALVTLGMITA